MYPVRQSDIGTFEGEFLVLTQTYRMPPGLSGSSDFTEAIDLDPATILFHRSTSGPPWRSGLG